MTDAWRWAQRNPSAVLLYVQLGGLLLYPFLEGPSDKLGTLVLSLFGLVVLGLAVAAVRATPSLTCNTVPTSSSLMLVWIPSNCWRRMAETSLTFI